MTTPEAIARKEIDKQLQACGWDVQDKNELNIYAQLGVAVREFDVVHPDLASTLGAKLARLTGRKFKTRPRFAD